MENFNAGEALDLNKLEALAKAATPQNLDSAEDASQSTGYIECPECGGEGTVELTADYCNYDGKAMGVQFYGIGPEHKAAEAFFRAANPAAILKLIALARAGSAAPAGQQAEPALWVAYYNGQKSQNVARDAKEKAEIERMADVMEVRETLTWEPFYAAPVSTAPTAPTADLVTLDSAWSAIAHVNAHNGPGRMKEAHAMLVLAAPTAGGGPSDPVVEANRALLLERSRVGIRKYGVTLADAGLSRAELAQHALEEALDLANYLQTIIQTDAAIAAQPKDTTKGDA